MGSSLFSNDSTSTTNAPNAAGQTSNAPVVSINNNPYKSNSDLSFNFQTTDHGAVNAALGSVASIGEEAIYRGGQVSETAIMANLSSTQDVLNFGRQVLSGARDVVTGTVQEAFGFGKDALQGMETAVLASNNIASEALGQARSLVYLTEDLNRQNLEAYRDGIYVISDVAQRSNDAIAASTATVANTLEELDENRSIETGNTIKAVKELAEVVQTGGESIQAGITKAVAALAVVGLIFVAWRVAA